MRSLPFGRPMIGEAERAAVQEALSGPILVHGPRIDAFEQAFAAWTGAPHAVAVSSCTAAMHLTWFHLGLGPGDEVIVPAESHVATAHAVELAGARPVFVDADPATGNLDVSGVEAAITDKTSALAVVHYLGLPVEMEAVLEVARRHQLFVLEDCALAIGSRYGGDHVGLLGDVGCFSFYPVKHMTTAEGGMIITRSSELAAALRHKRAFGVDREFGNRRQPGIYDVTDLGFNYRLNEIQAALGIEQIRRIDGFLAARADNYRALRQALAEIEEVTLLAHQIPGGDHSHYCLVALLDSDRAAHRAGIVEQLKQRGVGTSVYYPRPIPHMSHYRKRYGHSEQSFPVASWISGSSIALPVGPHLSTDDMAYIAVSLKEAIAASK